MGDLNDDTPRRTLTLPQSTVGGTFQGFRLTWRIRENPLSEFDEPFVYRLMLEADLRSDRHNSAEVELLNKLGTLIVGHNAEVEAVLDHPVCYVYLHSDCIWGHLATNQDGDRTDMVFVQHWEDRHSLLILENTETGLRVVPQGRWQTEIGGQIGKLAAQWALANKSAKPPKRSGWKAWQPWQPWQPSNCPFHAQFPARRGPIALARTHGPNKAGQHGQGCQHGQGGQHGQGCQHGQTTYTYPLLLFLLSQFC